MLRPVYIEAGVSLPLVADVEVPQAIPAIATPPSASFSANAQRVRFSGFLGVNVGITGWLSAGLRLHGTDASVQWQSQERLPINVNDTAYLATIDHRRQLRGMRWDVLPYVRIMPWQHFALDLSIGAGFYGAPSLSQTQLFVDPLGIPFADGTLEQSTGAASLAATIGAVFDARASWMIPISDFGDIVVGLGFRRDLTSMVDGSGWTAQQFVPSIGLRIPMLPVLDPVQLPVLRDTLFLSDTITIVEAREDTVVVLFSRLTTQPEDTAVTEKVVVTSTYQRSIPKPIGLLEVSLSIDFMHSDGGARTFASVVPTRVTRVRTMPLIPIVVFNEGSVSVPKRYGLQPLHIQHEVLRIVADSLRANATRKVQVVAYHNGTMAGAARAQLQAEAVAGELRSGGKIGRGRINVQHDVATDSALLGVVYLRVANVDLQGTQRTTLTASRMPEMRIHPDVLSDASIREWRCEIRRAGRTVHSAQGIGAVPKELRWPMGEVTMRTDESLVWSVSFYVVTIDGTAGESEAASVTVRTTSEASEAEAAVTRYENIVFDAGAARWAATNGTASRECNTDEVFEGCTESERRAYKALVPSYDTCVMIQSEERRP